MIIFIDNEHEKGYDKPWGEKLLAARTRIKYRLEDLSGDICLIVRYTHATSDLLRELNVRAVFISGSGTDATEYSESEQAGLRAIIREKAWPTFGFCGGFQVMAETYGATLDRIGPMEDGASEAEDVASFAPGMKKELGYMPVEITEPHPLFEGLSKAPVMRQAHSWEIKDIPVGFKQYASTDISPIQLIIHESLPIIGTQFHPEYYTDEYPAGRILIENFLNWVR